MPSSKPAFQFKPQNPLRSIRLERGLRQADVTAGTAIPQSMLTKYETGKMRPRPERRRVLADFFVLLEADLFPDQAPAAAPAKTPAPKEPHAGRS